MAGKNRSRTRKQSLRCTAVRLSKWYVLRILLHLPKPNLQREGERGGGGGENRLRESERERERETERETERERERERESIRIGSISHRHCSC